MPSQAASWLQFDGGSAPYSWANPNRAIASDNSYAQIDYTGLGNYAIHDYDIKLLNDSGVAFTDNKADTHTAWPGTDTVANYGGVSDLWGATITPAIVNDADFGIYLIVELQDPTLAKGKALTLWDGQFSIPVDATIDGISVSIERKRTYDARAGTPSAQVDRMTLTVHYTEASLGTWRPHFRPRRR